MFGLLQKFSRAVGGDYDATITRKRRRQPVRAGRSEDSILTDHKRRLLSGTTQDVQRNFAIAAWAIRQHLNYVSSFTFQCRTGNEGFDQAVERFITNWSKRQNCDVRRRHPFRRMIRLAEASRVVHGDFFLLKLTGAGARGKLQAIESDLIRTPDNRADGRIAEDIFDMKWVNGVQVNKEGAATHYAIHRRSDKWGSYELDRRVRAESLFVHGYYDRFDQVRGVSPISSAITSMQDVYEGFDYALAKIKVAQLFGLAIYRDATEGIDDSQATIDSDGDDVLDSQYEVDFHGGPQLLDLLPGDRAEFLESRSPPSETVDFLKMMIHVAIKALDLPYSFFDESFTNFYGSRAGLIQYQHSAKSKIADNQDLLSEITRWRLLIAVLDGQLSLPRGLTIEDVSNACEWVPDGIPWWDPLKEVKGHAMAIANGLDNPQRVCRQSGTDFFENIDRLEEAKRYAEQRGITLNFGATSTAARDEEDGNEASSDSGAQVEQPV